MQESDYSLTEARGHVVVAVYGFEAKSIQSFVLEGGKLVDMVAASGLVDDLARASAPGGGDGFGRVVLTLSSADEDFAGSLKELRRAGGALTVTSERRDLLLKFRQAWTLHVTRGIPSLSFVDAIAEGSDLTEALDELRKQLREASKAPNVSLPLLAPGVKRAPRTGRAVVALDYVREREALDEGTRSKREFARVREGLDVLGARCVGQAQLQHVVFPTDLDPDAKDEKSRFPFEGDNRTVGIVHADGNGLGARIIALVDDAKHTGADAGQALKAVSAAIAAATEAAVQQSTLENIVGRARTLKDERQVLPMRPIIIGGDDVTMIVRGDIALDWTVTFLKGFRKHTAAQIGEATRQLKESGQRGEAELVTTHFGDGLSAGAGILFVASNMPFDQAYRVCEDLAAHAKMAAKGTAATVPPSLISIHRITASALDSYEEVLARELCIAGGGTLTMNPYRVPDEGDDEAAAKFPSVDDLSALAEILREDSFPNGPLREYASLLGSDPYGAKQVWERFWHVAERRGTLGPFRDLVGKLLGTEVRRDGDRSADGRTPILDALSLNAARQEMSRDQ